MARALPTRSPSGISPLTFGARLPGGLLTNERDGIGVGQPSANQRAPRERTHPHPWESGVHAGLPPFPSVRGFPPHIPPPSKGRAYFPPPSSQTTTTAASQGGYRRAGSGERDDTAGGSPPASAPGSPLSPPAGGCIIDPWGVVWRGWVCKNQLGRQAGPFLPRWGRFRPRLAGQGRGRAPFGRGDEPGGVCGAGVVQTGASLGGKRSCELPGVGMGGWGGWPASRAPRSRQRSPSAGCRPDSLAPGQGGDARGGEG